jgi:3-oxoacyl-[acyl-carrier-protein] synthase-1
VIPGEGATAILVVRQGVHHKGGVLARIHGTATALETDSVFGKRTSVGDGLIKALANAVKRATLAESDIGFRVSDMNGERYRGNESMYVGARFYRTIREHLSTWYPAMSVGDLGAAVGPLLVIVAAMAMGKGYAPGGPCHV